MTTTSRNPRTLLATLPTRLMRPPLVSVERSDRAGWPSPGARPWPALHHPGGRSALGAVAVALQKVSGSGQLQVSKVLLFSDAGAHGWYPYLRRSGLVSRVTILCCL